MWAEEKQRGGRGVKTETGKTQKSRGEEGETCGEVARPGTHRLSVHGKKYAKLF